MSGSGAFFFKGGGVGGNFAAADDGSFSACDSQRGCRKIPAFVDLRDSLRPCVAHQFVVDSPGVRKGPPGASPRLFRFLKGADKFCSVSTPVCDVTKGTVSFSCS